jgi:hypothetical protein
MDSLSNLVIDVNMLEYLKALGILDGLVIGINLLCIVGIPMAFIVVVGKITDRIFRK